MQRSYDQRAVLGWNIAYVVFRIGLVLLIGVLVSVFNDEGWLNNSIGIVSVLVGMVVIWFPVLGRVPRVVEQNHRKRLA